MERRTFLKLAALVPGLALAGCGGSKTLLSPREPTMLSIWHVYGEQADSPMNRLLTEFNDTVGKEKGILLNVTNMTNSAAIGSQLQDAKADKPGALDLPDLFSAHASDASALGIETLVDWNDWFTAEDMAAYVPGFVQDGIIDGRQVVFPVSKSTQLIFLNGSQYARFAADTGAQLSTLATWDGFFEMAGAYRQWSQGKPFCALDYPLRLVELNALEQGSGELYKGIWYDLTNETFRASWMEFARALVQEPQLLGLDEPIAGLDPRGRDELTEIINELHQDGVTMVIISHNMDDVARIATRAAVLHKGRLAMLGTPREIFSRGDELAAMGLDVPQTVQLCQALRAGGMDVPDCLTNEELCDAICRALGKEAAAHA